MLRQHSINVDATPWRCINIDATLYKYYVSTWKQPDQISYLIRVFNLQLVKSGDFITHLQLFEKYSFVELMWIPVIEINVKKILLPVLCFDIPYQCLLL